MCNWFVPVVSTTFGFARRFAVFCSWSPAQKCNAPSSQTVGSGVTCGRPSPRTVESQNISDLSRMFSTSAHGNGPAPGSLKSPLNSTVGSLIKVPFVS